MKSHNESLLKTRFVAQCVDLGWYARRIEDSFSVGVLDIVVISPIYPVLFIEAKITDGIKFGPTERQYVEGIRINKAGGLSGGTGTAMAVLIGWRNDVMYVEDWGREAYVTKAFKQGPDRNYGQTLEDWLKWKTKV